MEHGVVRQASVSVLSDNIISSLGWTTRENFDALCRGETGIGSSASVLISGLTFPISLIDHQELSRHVAESQLLAFTRLEQWCIVSVRDALSRLPESLPREEMQLILSTTKGNIALLEPNGHPDCRVFLSEMAKKISRFFGMIPEPIVVSNACISGVLAIDLGASLIRSGQCRHVVVVGADEVTPFVLSGFASFQSLSQRPCTPFDANRDGLSLGEAVATMVLGTESDLGCPDDAVVEPTVFVLGGGSSNDANHISGPSRTGDGLCLAICEALRSSGMEVQDIAWVNVHGTATLYNDEMEAKALNMAAMGHIPVNALKGYFGHTLGAAGVLECILSVASLRNQTLLPTLGYSECGVSIPLAVVTEATNVPAKAFLKTASGFGGCNAALIFGLECAQQEEPVPLYPLKKIADCFIAGNEIRVCGERVYSGEGLFDEFIRAAFKGLERPYMKFYKMDRLSRLAYVAVEYLMDATDCARLEGKMVALVLANKSASLDTDRQHLRAYRENDGQASPSIFVYTLPNVLMGELCIRHKWQGRNLFLVSEQYNEPFMDQYVARLFSSGSADACIYGWVDILDEDYAASLTLALPGKNVASKGT